MDTNAGLIAGDVDTWASEEGKTLAEKLMGRGRLHQQLARGALKAVFHGLGQIQTYNRLAGRLPDDKLFAMISGSFNNLPEEVWIRVVAAVAFLERYFHDFDRSKANTPTSRAPSPVPSTPPRAFDPRSPRPQAALGFFPCKAISGRAPWGGIRP